ncbi:hypothetical protein M569_12545 [Genlisea aurea]|uniref:Uncharacterized protein n=1 Tax=Genlisea aurea TaxID=192259 RepID=S8DHD0_9LAMI|nr:hypothetical protein M569_12545 [Genlisea aurea]
MSEPEESPGDKSPPPVADESQPVTEESSAEVVDEAAQPATEESSAEVVDEAAQPATEESSAEVVESPEGEKSVGEAVHEQAEEVTENAKTVIADVKDFFTSEVEKKEEDDKTAEATDGETSDPYPPTTETTPLPIIVLLGQIAAVYWISSIRTAIDFWAIALRSSLILIFRSNKIQEKITGISFFNTSGK